MTYEIKERPDKPGIWQRESGMSVISLAYENEAGRLMLTSTSGYCRPSDEVVSRWRLIIDRDGKQVCDPDEPWPPKTRIEKRRVVQYQDSKNRYRVAYYAMDSTMKLPLTRTICDEIRDCEIGEDGTVIGVWSDSV